MNLVIKITPCLTALNWFPSRLVLCFLQYFPHKFYPRQVLALGYCRCLRVCMCMCVSMCPSITSLSMQNSLAKVPIVCRAIEPDLQAWNSKFIFFWVCPRHNSPPIQATTNKFRQKVQTNLFMVPIIFFLFFLLLCKCVCVWGGGGTFDVKFSLLIFKNFGWISDWCYTRDRQPYLRPELGHMYIYDLW